MFSLARPRAIIFGLIAVLFAAIVACGDDATPAAAPAPAAKAAPAATATPTPTTAVKAKAKGTLDVSIGEIGASSFNMSDQTRNASWWDQMVTHEAMFVTEADGSVGGRLVKEWTIDDTGLVTTFKLQEGVKWHGRHGDWGEVDADDLIFSIEEVSREGSIHSSAAGWRRLALCDECTLEKVDNLTVRLTRPSPTIELTWWSNNVGGQLMWLHSKKHFDAMGRDVSAEQSVGTGPWELLDWSDGVFRQAKAVTDHWRHSPDWDQTYWWEIREEITRLANFQAGLLDTGSFGSPSITAIQNLQNPDIKYMSIPGAYWIHLDFTGGYYYNDHPAHQGANAKTPIGAGDTSRRGVTYTVEAGLDCAEVPYVSCDRDTSSAEWDKARKVRVALNMVIDRDALVNNIFQGNADPVHIGWWMGHDARRAQAGLDDLVYEYDPVAARKLLTEAGYATGPDVDMVIHPGFVPGDSESAEAVANMMEKAGINVNISRLAFAAFRPTLVRRTAHEIYNNADSPNSDPTRTYAGGLAPTGGYNYGFEHPEITAIADEAITIADPEIRWPLIATAATWIFDNAMIMPLVQVSSVWPLGAEIDRWEPLGGNKQWLSNWEYVPHRQ